MSKLCSTSGFRPRVLSLGVAGQLAPCTRSAGGGAVDTWTHASPRACLCSLVLTCVRMTHRAAGIITRQVTWRQLEQYLFPRLRDIWQKTPFRRATPLDPSRNVYLRKVVSTLDSLRGVRCEANRTCRWKKKPCSNHLVCSCARLHALRAEALGAQTPSFEI